MEESTHIQKSRLLWMKMGDANTQFFQQVVQSRTDKNRIDALMNEEVIIVINEVQLK